MRDVTLRVLRTARGTLRALRDDMRQARRWENWRELAAMRRFLIRLLGDLPRLYGWAAGAGQNPPGEEFRKLLASGAARRRSKRVRGR